MIEVFVEAGGMPDTALLNNRKADVSCGRESCARAWEHLDSPAAGLLELELGGVVIRAARLADGTPVKIEAVDCADGTDGVEVSVALHLLSWLFKSGPPLGEARPAPPATLHRTDAGRS